ncbi:MAG: YuzB family protein [Clostridia bacterium]|nr:YuzB family protein [Clostridia bacterium]
MAEIRFCENNFSHGTDEVVEKIKKEFPKAAIDVEPCLGFCGECAQAPYAIVDDEFIQADDPDDLYEVIREKLSEEG